MIAFGRSHCQPIGLQLSGRFATLVQVVGPPGAQRVHAIAHGELPAPAEADGPDRERTVAGVLKRLVSDHPFRGRRVVSCLGPDELFVQNVRLPRVPAEEVSQIVRWEAEERLPFPVEEAEVRHLLAAEVRQENDVKQEVILLACHREAVLKHAALLESAGLVPVSVDVAPRAAVRALRGEAAEDDGTWAFVDVGEDATTIVFADSGRILFLKSVAVAAGRFDESIADHLGLAPQDAFRMRDTVFAAPRLDAEDEVHRSVVEAVRPTLDQLATEVELCIRYFRVTFRGRSLRKLVVAGHGGSVWLADFLQDQLGLPCEAGNPFLSLASWPTSGMALERPWRWATATGLSLASR